MLEAAPPMEASLPMTRYQRQDIEAMVYKVFRRNADKPELTIARDILLDAEPAAEELGAGVTAAMVREFVYEAYPQLRPAGGNPGRPYGVPKTEAERRATHQQRFGTSELPPRGTGRQGAGSGWPQRGDTVYLRGEGNEPYRVLESWDERGAMPRILVEAQLPGMDIKPTKRVDRGDVLRQPENIAQMRSMGGGLPPRTSETMSEAIAMSSPSGRSSRRTAEAAKERLRQRLFGRSGLPAPSVIQPEEKEVARRQAAELRSLAERGMHPQSYLKRAEALERIAADPPVEAYGMVVLTTPGFQELTPDVQARIMGHAMKSIHPYDEEKRTGGPDFIVYDPQFPGPQRFEDQKRSIHVPAPQLSAKAYAKLDDYGSAEALSQSMGERTGARFVVTFMLAEEY
jgi:hypothetical protein